MLNCFIFIDYDSLRDVWKKKTQKPDRIVNIDKEKYEINSLHSCYEFICKEIFVVRLSKNQYKSTILIICKKKNKNKRKKLIINIASIFITLTEINNETHDVAKKNKTKQKQKQDKTAPIGFALSV